MEGVLQDIGKSSLSELAYTTLKEKILTMEFEPGKVISEVILSEMLGVSRMPIRSAMQRLFEEGWLDNSNKKMIRVAYIKENDIDEVYEIRELIECAALKRIFEEQKTWEFSFELEGIVVKMRSVIDDPIKLEQLDLDYHTCLVTIFDNQRLAKIFNGNREEILRMAMISHGTEAKENYIIQDLTALFNLIREKNLEKAAALHLNHLRNGRKETLEALSTLQQNT